MATNNKTFVRRLRRLKVNNETNCWEWQGSTGTGGYGFVGIKLRGKATTQSAAKYFYEQLVGPIDEGYELDHIVCNNRICCNPSHVVPTTRTYNSRRRSSGKLSFVDAIVINLLKGKTNAVEVSKHFNIKGNYIYDIWDGKVWKEYAL